MGEVEEETIIEPGWGRRRREERWVSVLCWVLAEREGGLWRPGGGNVPFLYAVDLQVYPPDASAA